MKSLPLCCLLLLHLDYAAALNHFIDRFEPLNYRISHRNRRSLTGSFPVRIRFDAYNRSFPLLLRLSSPSILLPSALLYSHGEDPKRIVDLNLPIYEGEIEGDPESSVRGSLFDGIFDGFIETGGGEGYTVERSTRYANSSADFHSFIYHNDDINHPRFRRSGNSSGSDDGKCGVTPDFIAKSRLRQELDEKNGKFKTIRNTEWERFVPKEKKNKINERSGWDQDNFSPARNTKKANRQKEEKEKKIERDDKNRYNVRTCTVAMTADHDLYDVVFHSEGNRNHELTVHMVTAIMMSHLKRASAVFSTTNFDGVTGINLKIAAITIHKPSECVDGEPVAGSTNPVCAQNLDSEPYLDQISLGDNSPYCISFYMTFKDFMERTLGLAWMATPDLQDWGGICDYIKRHTPSKRLFTHNTGVVTLVNQGHRSPPMMSEITMVHEIGHTFGSGHDDDDDDEECQGDSENGQFIMSTLATRGNKKNNAFFSSCSIKNISLVLNELLVIKPETSRYERKNCFIAGDDPICGNSFVENGEACDCGLTASQCALRGDFCCRPMEEGHRGCTLMNAATQCSISQGTCCDGATCRIRGKGRKCQEATECRYSSKCTGAAAECPPGTPRNEGKPCEDGSKVCKAGECRESICEYLGYQDCSATGNETDKCYVACIVDGSCVSSRDIPSLDGYHASLTQYGREGLPGILLQAGTPCDERNGGYIGICDVFRRCRSVRTHGGLFKTFMNTRALFEVENLKRLWWIFPLVGVVIALGIAITIKFFTVHTPSSNPRKSKALKFKEGLKNPKVYVSNRELSKSSRSVRQTHVKSQKAVPSAPEPSSAITSNKPQANSFDILKSVPPSSSKSVRSKSKSSTASEPRSTTAGPAAKATPLAAATRMKQRVSSLWTRAKAPFSRAPPSSSTAAPRPSIP